MLDVPTGQTIRMKDGSTAEVLENMGDGIWLKVRMTDGQEDLAFCEDIAGLLEPTGSSSDAVP